jgi:hypothetical protein
VGGGEDAGKRKMEGSRRGRAEAEVKRRKNKRAAERGRERERGRGEKEGTRWRPEVGAAGRRPR